MIDDREQAIRDGMRPENTSWAGDLDYLLAALDEARATITRLEADLATNASMLARQCDLAREAETRTEAAGTESREQSRQRRRA